MQEQVLFSFMSSYGLKKSKRETTDQQTSKLFAVCHEALQIQLIGTPLDSHYYAADMLITHIRYIKILS